MCHSLYFYNGAAHFSSIFRYVVTTMRLKIAKNWTRFATASLRTLKSNRLLVKARSIQLVAFDVDGVLTDGSLILGDKGDEYKIFHAHDGLGLVMLRGPGWK